MQDCYGIDLAFYIKVCSLRIYEGMYIFTIDVFKKMWYYVCVYNECKISQELRSTAEVVLHAEHPPFCYSKYPAADQLFSVSSIANLHGSAPSFYWLSISHFSVD